MSEHINPCFSVNMYDSDGDVVEECVFLHMGNTVLKFKDSNELEAFADNIKKMLPELRESEARAS